ncbi:MAG: hypothetical protein NTW86_28745 [Candidatus Sumerlaeota bacterium]|nr:hypothetical protein [Candidatus Sumerlaeota bacterium]
MACPEDLDPKNVCVMGKALVRERDARWEGGRREIAPHPMLEYRRTPVERLKHKLGLGEFRDVGPLAPRPLEPRRVVLPTKQHAGAPSEPVVRAGAKVREGDLVAKVPEGAFGAPIHASIPGRVVEASAERIVIER